MTHQDPYGRGREGGGGGLFAEIRRQMEEMLNEGRPPAPSVLPPPVPGTDQPSARHDPHTGLALAAMASYWMLPLVARKRRRRAARRRKTDAERGL